MESIPFDNKAETIDKNLADIKKLAKSLDLDKDIDRRQVRRSMKELSEGQWSILEDILLDIEVGIRTEILAEKRDRLPSINERIKLLTVEVKSRFSDDTEMRDILIKLIPSMQGVNKWLKRARWKEEVDRRMKDDTLFSSEKRAAMINKAYTLGLNGNTKFAEMWLKMSGELTNQTETKNTTLEANQRYQKALWDSKNTKKE